MTPVREAHDETTQTPASEAARAVTDPVLQVGRVARDTSRQRLGLGLVLAVDGDRVALRALATSRVWKAQLVDVRPVSAREERSMRLAAANTRSRSH